MKKLYAGTTLALAVLAATAALTLTGADPAPTNAAPKPARATTAPARAIWRPTIHGLTTPAEHLLPAAVSPAHPVRVVGTRLDHAGRPVITVRTAVDRSRAETYVKQAQRAKNAVGVELDVPMRAADVATGSDALRDRQWDLTTIHSTDSWPTSTGAGVTVAVIDSGVDATHPDLAGQVLPGYDVLSGTEGTSSDPFGHGTHVAGTIAALTGNGLGVGSVAPGAKILPIRVLDANGTGNMSDAATGIVYAADHGADVINMSLSANSPVDAVTNAIAYARSKGVVVIAAAGNQRQAGSPTVYPAADPGVVAVAATDRGDNVAFFSNRADYVDVAAPGTDILSTYPVAKGSYATMSGTSMAAPHVAAEAALIKSVRPDLSPDEVEQAIEDSAVDLGPPGQDPDYGFGRINAAAALAAVDTATSGPEPTATATTPAEESSTSPATPTEEPSANTATPTEEPSVTAPTPSEDPTADRLRPTVALSAPSQEVSYAATATTTFSVTAGGEPLSGRTAKVCVTESGGPERCTPATTDDAGNVSVRRTATASYEVRLMVDGTDMSESVTSDAANVAVRATLAVSRDDTTMTVLIGGGSDQVVEIQQLDGEAWPTVLSYRAMARATVNGLSPGATYRVVVLDSPTIFGVTGDPVQGSAA